MEEDNTTSRQGNTDTSNTCGGERCNRETKLNDYVDDEEDHFEDSFATHPEEEENQEPSPSCINEHRSSSSTSILLSAFPTFIHTGLQRKAPFTELKYWMALSLTLDGRDKITKVLQYASRLLGWWFLSKVKTSQNRRGHGRRFMSLYKSLGKSRKAFRLGRSINEVQKIASIGWLNVFYWHLKQQY